MTEERFDRIENKLDHLIDKVSAIDVTMAKNTVSLSEHIYRTDLLEKQLAPVTRRMDMVKGVIGFFALVAAAATFGAAIMEIVFYIKTGSL
jgi:hypothetical protein